MSPPTAPPTRDLTTFVGFLADLEQSAVDYVVIGGCAVGAYARLSGETVLSDDLDIYLSESALDELLVWARRQQIAVLKMPQPRAIPVAVLRWKDQEINAFTASNGLPPAAVALRTCREFVLAEHHLTIPVLDPFDLLANKLAVGREKDQPHVTLLLRYLEGEIVSAFGADIKARERLAPVRRYLAVRGLNHLPVDLAARLVPLANDPALRRFLIPLVSDALQAERLLSQAQDERERLDLGQIAARSGAPRGQ